MKKFILTLAAGAAIVSAGAQSKLDLRTQMLISEHQQQSVKAVMPKSILNTKSIDAPSTENASLLIEVSNPDDLQQLIDNGAEISGLYGNIVACDMPINNINTLNDDDNVLRVSTSQRRRLLNDKARGTTGMNVDKVHNGTDLTRSFKGDGVVVGHFDMGVDPNHVNFYNDDQTESRVSRIWKYVLSSTGRLSESAYTNPTAISKFTTDDKNETHGTHTLGTLAGSYNGGTSTTKYYGMAPHADIAFACGDATDNAILNGVKNIINYAKSVGKPAVVSLSLGTNCGHHDGTDAFSKALDALAAETPIVIASGNEADMYIVANKTFTDDDTEMTTALTPCAYYLEGNYQAYGNIEVIANDATPFTMQLGLYNKSTAKVVATLNITSSTTTSWVTSGTGITNTTFSSTYYSGSKFGAAIGLCPDNNRYYAMVTCDLYNKSSSTNIVPVIIVKGKAGQTINMYTDGYTEFSDLGVATFTDGSTDGTVNDMACGQNPIVIGSYITRRVYTNENPVSDISDFSSYGKLIDGRTLPHVCAPGEYIVSSMSLYYKDSSYFDATYDKIYSTVSALDRTNYWCHMQGTSMATPAAAGTIALWMEANPELTPAEVREIAMSTARSDSKVTGGKAQAPYQWGAGKIDAYKGIQEVLARKDSGVGSINVDASAKLMVRPLSDRTYEVFLAGATSLNATLYNLAGVAVASASANGDTLTLDASNLAPGIYILASNGESIKLAIK